MATLTPFADLAKAAFRRGVQPALFVGKRAARYRAAGITDAAGLPVCRVDPCSGCSSCHSDCVYTLRLGLAHLAKYRALERCWRCRPWLGTACAVELDRYKGYADYAAAVGRRTGDAIRRSCNKARRLGYATGFFHPPFLRGHMLEILASKRFRSGGFVPYGLFGRGTAHVDHGHVAGYRQQPPCALHWTLTWGVFATRDAHGQPLPAPRWTLAGFVKLRRVGSLVHALQIMGHGDHLAAGVNDLMHMELMRWLIDDPDGHAAGVRHYMYGALEHAGDGLAAWKSRRGFEPVLLSIGT